MPIVFTFAAGDADYVDKLNQMITAFNAATGFSGTFASIVSTGALTVGGNTVLDGGSLVFNEAGADKDARFEGDTDAQLLFLDASTDRIGIGTQTPAHKVTVASPITKGGGGLYSAHLHDTTAFAQNVGGGLVMSGLRNGAGALAYFAAIEGAKENATADNESGALVLSSSLAGVLTNRARIDSTGHFLVGKTAIDSETTVGVDLSPLGHALFTRSGGNVLYVNRLVDDGALAEFYQASTLEGSISVSGTTISYNAFLGSHWAQLEDGERADILPGTVMETVDPMCEWPGESNDRLPKVKVSDRERSSAVYGVFLGWDDDEFRDEQATEDDVQEWPVVEEIDGTWRRRMESRQIKRKVFEEHPLFDEAGEPVMRQIKAAVTEPILEERTVSYEVEFLDKAGVRETATIHVPTQVTVGELEREPAVYEQVKHHVPVMRRREGVNDMYVAAIGIYRVRLQAGQAPQRGDLLESAGDGTSRVQADDLVRSSTVGKVASAAVIETYEDGSFTVPCVLMCG